MLFFLPLEKSNNLSATGARVAWKEVCKPKEEGGIGIRLLEDFEIVFMLKPICNFFTNASFLWVAWLNGNVFARKSFWLTETSNHFSRPVKSMLQLKDNSP